MLVFAVEMGNIEASNPGMVEATREAEWPPRGLTTEPECGPNPPPQEALREMPRRAQALASLRVNQPS